eukprot:gb/GECH01012554.1/.p1 GENE.gb/GECH01012554.1/~~gb/GECH01012554.1/.p1  ORF type:complete len:423 (+),score=54.87 gb/GECH01012554.1/:1-1269(+)
MFMSCCLCCESLCCCCKMIKSDVSDDSADEPLIVREDEGVFSRARFHLMGIRFMYTLFMIVGFIIALTLWKIHPGFVVWSWLQHIGLCEDKGCSGNYAVYRVSLALMLFYGFHCLLASPIFCCIPARMRNFFQRKLFFLKWILFFALLLIGFYIPNQFYIGWGWIQLIAASLFIICQILVLIDFAYNWNRSWVDKEENFWNAMIVFSSIGLYVIGLGLCITMYILFHNYGVNIFFITFNIVLGIFYTIGSLRATHGSLLPSAIVFVYSCYLTFSAVSSEPNKEYNPFYSSETGTSNTVQLILGLGFASISLFYTAFSTGSSTSAFSLNRQNSFEEEDEEEAEHKQECYSHFIFHLVNLLAAGYLAMIFTGWEIRGSSDEVNVSQNWASVWVKMAANWLCVLIYFWTLIAPAVLRNRDFGWDD